MTTDWSQRLARLQQHYQHVASTRMRDVPILNPALSVETVGFTEHPEGLLGVLITPWFISLVILPKEQDAWQECRIGTEHSYPFASGRYVFQMAGEEGIGRYRTCALLSPVLEIVDQQTAVAVAESALASLHQADCADPDDGRDQAMAGDSVQANQQAASNNDDEPVRRGPRQLSRRQLLTGALRRDI